MLKRRDPVVKLNRLGITAFVLRYRIATELKDSSIYEDLEEQLIIFLIIEKILILLVINML